MLPSTGWLEIFTLFWRMNVFNVSKCLVPRIWQMFSRSIWIRPEGVDFDISIFFTFPFFDAFHRNGESASLFYILSQFLFIDLNSPTANIKGDARDRWNSRWLFSANSVKLYITFFSQIIDCCIQWNLRLLHPAKFKISAFIQTWEYFIQSNSRLLHSVKLLENCIQSNSRLLYSSKF